ncbi:MAG TPA: ABC transporter permease subunit [Streptosporangiaceae bacterium]|jgi:ABC-type transport system involved in multi-copper enzyme maturation permease subunit
MTAGTTARQWPAPAPAAAEHGGFWRAVLAEWTKFRSVRGLVIGTVVAALAMLLVGLFAAGSARFTCPGGPGFPTKTGAACLPRIPRGPGGQAVTDSFYFVHQPLAANGSITAAVTSLTGVHAAGNGQTGAGPGGAGPLAGMTKGIVGWAKAGIIIKTSTSQGTAYAAMMATGGHGVRMQYDFTQDIAGLAGQVSPSAPRWLRLTRSGDTITGYDSADGSRWARVGTVRLTGLPATVQAGLFVTSPVETQTTSSFGGTTSNGGPSQATGIFGHVSLSGAAPGKAWAGANIGAGRGSPGTGVGGFHQAGGAITVTGSGDIAPVVAGPTSYFPTATIEDHLVGTFAGLIAMAVIAAMFITTEYRRGLIRLTLAATPRRGEVLAAKAVVVGAVTFAAGLAASVIAVVAGPRLSRDMGLYVLPVSLPTGLRVIAGTAALLAVAAVFALALGTVLRRSAVAVTAAIVLLVLPYILGVASVLPAGPAEWLLRVTPAAAFAIQQSVPAYHQVSGPYGPPVYFPLGPWSGFAVLCGWTALALGLATYLLRRRDA